MNFSNRQLVTLKQTIKKWEKTVSANGFNSGETRCPLCVRYSRRGTCLSCPVQLFTGEVGCGGTPYHDWAKHIFVCPHYCDEAGGCDTCKKLAKKELNFLKRLYKKGGGL